MSLSPIVTPDDLAERLLARLAHAHSYIAPLKTKQRWDDALSALGGICSADTASLLQDAAAADAHRSLLRCYAIAATRSKG